MSSIVDSSGRECHAVPRRARPGRLPDAESLRRRDAMVIAAILRGGMTKADVASLFGLSRRQVWRIEERVFARERTNPTRRWIRPELRARRGDGTAKDVGG